jgi:hypothetical protein
MNSNQSSQTDRVRADNLWRKITEIYVEVAENQRARLTGEASYCGLDDPSVVLRIMDQLKPELAVKLFEEENDIDLDHLDEADPYNVAVGVLKMMYD